jgi:hypothetical protein
MIEINAILVIAIAKLDWILAIEPVLLKFIFINRIYGFPHYSLTKALLLDYAIELSVHAGILSKKICTYN